MNAWRINQLSRAFTVCLLSIPGAAVTAHAVESNGIYELFQADSEVLARHEAAGINAVALFAHAAGGNLRFLNQSRHYLEMVSHLSADIEDEKQLAAKAASDTTRKIELFKPAWFLSESTKFFLVGIVRRADRHRQESGICGELRLIFRAGYDLSDRERQFLPMTMMAVFEIPRTHEVPGCKLQNQHYLNLLAEISAGRKVFNRVETNLLISHWSFSGVEPLSEQTRYLLRVFKLAGLPSHLSPSPLENTPNVEKIAENPELFSQFQSWIRDSATIHEVEAGFFHLPEKFAAARAVSVSPYAPAYLENAPYSRLIGGSSPLAKKTLERMDSLSCQGCHQIGSLAGFHFPGIANVGKPAEPATPVSPHFIAIQNWRTEDIAGKGDRDFPDLVALVTSNPRVRCGNDKDQCTPIPAKEIGTFCDPATVAPRKGGVGAQFNDQPFENCGTNRFCAFGRAGFPGGYCSEYCSKISPADGCFPVPSLGPFTACVERTWDHTRCAVKHAVLAKLKTCRQHSECRSDYACITSVEKTSICGPTYLVPGFTLKHREPPD